MYITAGVRGGTHKSICDDVAVINDVIINCNCYQCESDSFHIIGVADGVGGYSGGKEASLFVTEALSKMVYAECDNGIRAQFEQLNRDLLKYATKIPNKDKMATTLTAILSSKDKYFLTHIGNTRVYVARGSYLKQLTTDHTTYQWLLTQNQIEEAEHCNKNEISACMGGGLERLIHQLEIETVFSSGLPNLLIFTTDGIHEYIDLDRLEDLVFSARTDQEIIEAAMDDAERNGSTDDKTMIIVRAQEDE